MIIPRLPHMDGGEKVNMDFVEVEIVEVELEVETDQTDFLQVRPCTCRRSVETSPWTQCPCVLGEADLGGHDHRLQHHPGLRQPPWPQPSSSSPWWRGSCCMLPWCLYIIAVIYFISFQSSTIFKHRMSRLHLWFVCDVLTDRYELLQRRLVFYTRY